MKISEFNRLLQLAQEQGNGNVTLIGFRALNIKNWKDMYNQCSIESDKKNGNNLCLEMTQELIQEMDKIFDQHNLQAAKKELESFRAEEVLREAEKLDPANQYAELISS